MTTNPSSSSTTTTTPILLRVLIDTIGYIGPLEITSTTTLTQLRYLIQHNFDIDIIPKHYQFLSIVSDPSVSTSSSPSTPTVNSSLTLRIPVGTKQESTTKAIKFLPSITLLPLTESPIPVNIYVTLWHPHYTFRLWALPSCTIQNLRTEASRFWYLNPDDTVLTDDTSTVYPDNAFVHDILQTYQSTLPSTPQGDTENANSNNNSNNPHRSTQPLFILHMKVVSMEKLIDPRSFRTCSSTSTTSSSTTNNHPNNQGNGKTIVLSQSVSSAPSARNPNSSSKDTINTARRSSRRVSTNLTAIHEEQSAAPTNNDNKKSLRRLTQSEHFLDPDIYADIYDTSFIDDGASTDNQSITTIHLRNSREQNNNDDEWNTTNNKNNSSSPSSSSRRHTRSDSLMTDNLYTDDTTLLNPGNTNSKDTRTFDNYNQHTNRTLLLQNFVQSVQQQINVNTHTLSTLSATSDHPPLSPSTTVPPHSSHQPILLPGAAVKYVHPSFSSDLADSLSSGYRLPFSLLEDEKVFTAFLPLEQRLWRIFTWYASAGDSHDCFHLRARQWRCLLDDCGILLNTNNSARRMTVDKSLPSSFDTSASLTPTATISIDIADVIFSSVLADGRRNLTGSVPPRSNAVNSIPLATLAKQNANRSHRSTLLQNNTVGKNTSGIDYFQFLRAIITIAVRHQSIRNRKGMETDNESVTSYSSLASSVRDTSSNSIKIPELPVNESTIIDTHINAIETVAYLLSDAVDTSTVPNTKSNRILRTADFQAFYSLLKDHIMPYSQHWLYDMWINEHKQLDLPVLLRSKPSLSPAKSTTEPESASSILCRFAPALVQLFTYYAFTPLAEREKDHRNRSSPSNKATKDSVNAVSSTNVKTTGKTNTTKELVHLMDILRDQEAINRTSNSKEDTDSSLISSFHAFADQQHSAKTLPSSSVHHRSKHSSMNKGSKLTVVSSSVDARSSNPRLDLQVNGISPNSTVVELMLKSTPSTVVNQNLRKTSSQFVKEAPTVQLVRGYASKVTQATQGHSAAAAFPLSEKMVSSSKPSAIEAKPTTPSSSSSTGSTFANPLSRTLLSMEAFFRFLTDIGLLTHGQLMLSMRTITEVYLASASIRGILNAYSAAGYDDTEYPASTDASVASNVSIAVLPSSSRVKLSFPQFLACLGRLAIRMGDQAIHTSLTNLLTKAQTSPSALPMLESAGAAHTDNLAPETTISIPLRTKALLQIISQNFAKINLVNIFELRKDVCGSQPEGLFNGVVRYQQIYNQMNRHDDYTDYLLQVSTCAKNAARLQKEWSLILQHQKQQQQQQSSSPSNGLHPPRSSPLAGESKDDYALRLARYVDGKVPVDRLTNDNDKSVVPVTSVVSHIPSMNHVYVYRKKQHNQGTDSLHTNSSNNRVIAPPRLPGKDERTSKGTNNGQLSLDDLESLWKDTVRLKEVQEKLLNQRRTEAKAVALTLHHDEWLLKLAKQKHQIQDDPHTVPKNGDGDSLTGNETVETNGLINESIHKLRKEQEELLIQDMREELRNTEVARRHAVWAQLQHARQLTAYAIKEATERQQHRSAAETEGEYNDRKESPGKDANVTSPTTNLIGRELSVPRSRSPIRSVSTGNTTMNISDDANGLPPNLTPEQAIQLLYAYGSGYLPSITPQQENQLLQIARPLLDTMNTHRSSGSSSSNHNDIIRSSAVPPLPSATSTVTDNYDTFLASIGGRLLNTSPYSLSNQQPSPSHEYPLMNGSPLTNGIMDVFNNTNGSVATMTNQPPPRTTNTVRSTVDEVHKSVLTTTNHSVLTEHQNYPFDHGSYHKAMLTKPPTVLGRAISMDQTSSGDTVNPVGPSLTTVVSETTETASPIAMLQYRLSSGSNLPSTVPAPVPSITIDNRTNMIMNPSAIPVSTLPINSIGSPLPLLPTVTVQKDPTVNDTSSTNVWSKDSMMMNNNNNSIGNRTHSRMHMSPERIDLARQVSSNHLLFTSSNSINTSSSLSSPSQTGRSTVSTNLRSPTLPPITVTNQDTNNILSGEDIDYTAESEEINTDGSLDTETYTKGKMNMQRSSSSTVGGGANDSVKPTTSVTLVKDDKVTVPISRTHTSESNSNNHGSTESTDGNRSPIAKSPVNRSTSTSSTTVADTKRTDAEPNSSNTDPVGMPTTSTSNITAANHGNGKMIVKNEAVDDTNEGGKGRKEKPTITIPVTTIENAMTITTNSSDNKEKSTDRSLSPHGKSDKTTKGTKSVPVSPKDKDTVAGPMTSNDTPSNTTTFTAPAQPSSSTSASSSSSTTNTTAVTVPSLSSSISREEQRNRDIIEKRLIYKRLLLSGTIFIKYGRSGFPHKRIIWVDENLEMIRWRKTNTKLPPSLGLPGTNGNGSTSNDKDKEIINVADIVDIIEGATTPVFLRNTRAITSANCCFSIVCSSRTLDLEAESSAQRDEWVTALMALKKYRRML